MHPLHITYHTCDMAYAIGNKVLLQFTPFVCDAGWFQLTLRFDCCQSENGNCLKNRACSVGPSKGCCKQMYPCTTSLRDLECDIQMCRPQCHFTIHKQSVLQCINRMFGIVSPVPSYNLSKLSISGITCLTPNQSTLASMTRCAR